MGCDIHSLAEAKNPEGAWEVLGNEFPYAYGMRTVAVSDEVLDRIPDSHRDGYMLDLVDHYIYERDVENKDWYENDLPEIEPGSPLAQKILDFKAENNRLVEWGRNREEGGGYHQINKQHGREGVSHDPDAWNIWRHTYVGQLGQDANLTDDERATLREAILNYRSEDEDDDPVYSRLTVHFHRLHGPGWLARWRGTDGDESDPEYLDEGFPYFDEALTRHNEPFDSRNYSLFAILADVRNGVGFAGIDTGDRIEPISEPRGVPEDASPEYKKLVEQWDCDGHSHSYHTLAQLKAYDWDQPVVYRGIVPAVDYLIMKEKGWPEDRRVKPPGSVSGGISGQGIVTFTPDGFERWVERGYPYLQQPESSLFSPEIFVTADLVPDIDARASALAAAPGLQKVRGPADVEFITEQYETVMKETETDKLGVDPMELLLPKEKEDLKKIFPMETPMVPVNGVRPHVKVEWEETRRPNAGREFWNAVAIMEKICQERGISEDEIRAVFFFDN
jgi:hypothetical protein